MTQQPLRPHAVSILGNQATRVRPNARCRATTYCKGVATFSSLTMASDTSYEQPVSGSWSWRS